MKKFVWLVFILVCPGLIACTNNLFAQSINIKNDKSEKKIIFSNEKLKAVLNYDREINISSFIINGEEVIAGDSGIYSMVKTNGHLFSTLSLMKVPQVEVSGSIIQINNIVYGNNDTNIEESWTIIITKDSIKLNISRHCPEDMIAEKTSFPVFNFKSINTWDGAYQDYGGLAWFYLFNKKEHIFSKNSKLDNIRKFLDEKLISSVIFSPGF